MYRSFFIELNLLENLGCFDTIADLFRYENGRICLYDIFCMEIEISSLVDIGLI